MNLGLEGKVAVVAASSAGIGRAAATQFAREGARVVMNGRTAATLHEAAQAVRDSTGADVAEVVADMADANGPASLIQRAVERFDGVDVLVTNAGGPPAGKFDALSDTDWEKAFQLTLMSAVRLIRAALPHLSRTQGSVVNVQSWVVKQPDPVMVLSDSLRVAVVALSKALADECAGNGVRFNTVGPGQIWTQRQMDLTRLQAEREGTTFEDARARRAAGIPMKRFGSPEDMGNAIAFLASPAAGYITGQTLLIDGGLARFLF
ncbi:MAG TPA: SDR family oxidoreductase [Chloroflexota bacterium]|nr:SDR family oxidoreductase [Chloroflexota bacterium]